MTEQSTFRRNARSSLYGTSNREYGSAWAHDTLRPQLVNLRTNKVPTYGEIVESMNDFRKAERLIKSKIIKERLEQEGVDPNGDNHRFSKKTQFHVKGETYKYPTHGLNVGPPIYRTNNMNYGTNTPALFEIQDKYYPCNSTFTKAFTGGPFKFNGLNTVKTISTVHNNLNDI